jgi:hypothetical protein
MSYEPTARNPEPGTRNLKLIGAGFGRSGTMSIKAALDLLGAGPCYHMKIALPRFWHLYFFMRAWHGKKVNWKRFFRRYNSAVDWPTCSFYKELMQEYPEAKILLNVRDPEKWYDSMYETIWAIQPAFPFWFPPVVRKIHNEIIWEGDLKGVFEDREKAIEVYKDWMEEVKRSVPAERLLVYDIIEGWKPLCDFLGLPVPERPFPHINERNRFIRMIRLLKVLNWLVPLVFITSIILLVLFLADIRR